MITGWMRKLISQMKDGEYHTAKELADFMEVSEKTTRMRLKDLEYEWRSCAQHDFTEQKIVEYSKGLPDLPDVLSEIFLKFPVDKDNGHAQTGKKIES